MLMKRRLSFFILFIGIALSSFADDFIPAKIVIYRENVYQGSAISYKVYLNDAFLVKLKNNSYFEYECFPGDYRMYASNLAGSGISLKVEEGKTYYVRFGINVGFWQSTADVILVDSTSALSAIYGRNLKSLNENGEPVERPKNRIGFLFPFGGGFESHDLFTLENGDEASLSFGGGIGIGLTYGHEFNRYFDLSFDAVYKSSFLSPSIKNGDATFSRFYLSATPAVIIPVDGGDRMRFKIGAGPDLYLGNKFELEGREAGGFDDIFTYESAFGFHLSVVFELNVSDNCTFSYGLKWYDVSYDYEKCKNGYYFTDYESIYSPSGSGIDFLLGINFHF